ncbi:MAG: hypothetical protein IKP37_10275, partial [Paludibacteraceae bacterium]|nr:hypothetical protein [Paludibacteraceae bacterium]
MGRVPLVEDGTGATEFFYGRMGEVVKQRRSLVIPNVDEATYTIKWKSDSQNRILEMEYPDEEKIHTFTIVSGCSGRLVAKSRTNTATLTVLHTTPTNRRCTRSTETVLKPGMRMPTTTSR